MGKSRKQKWNGMANGNDGKQETNWIFDFRFWIGSMGLPVVYRFDRDFGSKLLFFGVRLASDRFGGCGARGQGGFVFFEGDAGVAHVAAGVHEGDELGGVFLEGFTGEAAAVLEDSIEILVHGHVGAGTLELQRIDMTVFADHVSSGLGLDARAFIDGLGVEVIFVTAHQSQPWLDKSRTAL
jgi:hypothetical protein